MLRRISAFLTCILVLTLSLSGWQNDCRQMAEKNATSWHQTSHADHSQHQQSTPASHHSSGDSAAPTHCQNAAACGSVSTALVEAVHAVTAIHGDIVVAAKGYVLISAARDLETPPPRA